METKTIQKLIFGAAPTSFPLPVEIPTPQGLRAATFTCLHLPQSEWSAMRDAHIEAIQKHFEGEANKRRADAEAAYDEANAAKGEAGVEVSAEERAAAVAALVKPMKPSEIDAARANMAADLLVKVIKAWDFKAKYNHVELVRFLDFYPTAIDAFFGQFNEAISGRRAGNFER